MSRAKSSLSSSSDVIPDVVILDDEEELTTFVSSSPAAATVTTVTTKKKRARTVAAAVKNEPKDEVDSDEDVTEPLEKKRKPSSLRGKKRMTKSASLQRYRDLSDALAQKKWKEVILPSVTKRMHGTHECWESRIATQGSGYCQLQLNGSGYGNQEGFYLLHIWSMRYHNRIPADLSHISDPDCSHLCHNKRCVNPAHLIFEEGRNNKRRNVCPCYVDTTLICPYIHHAPACLHAHSDFEANGIRKFSGY